MEFSKARVRRSSKLDARLRGLSLRNKEVGSFDVFTGKMAVYLLLGWRALTEAVSALKLEHHGEGRRWGGVVARENYESKGVPWGQLQKTWKRFKRVMGRGHHFPSAPQRSCNWRRTTPVTAWDAEQRAWSQQVRGAYSVIEKLRRRRDVWSSGYCSDWARKSFLAKDQYSCNIAWCACLLVFAVFKIQYYQSRWHLIYRRWKIMHWFSNAFS